MTAHAEKVARALGVEAFSITEFARAHGISRAQYYILKQKGLGPDEMHLLGRVLISREAASRWRKKHTRSAVAETAA
jgi:hypothetical protein